MLEHSRSVVPLGDDDIQRFNALRRTNARSTACRLRLKLSEDEIARLFGRALALPRRRRRAVPDALVSARREFAHVVGYVGRIDISEASRLDADLYSGSTHIRQDRHRAQLRGASARQARLRAGRGQRRQARAALDQARAPTPAATCI
jgi:cell division protein FtsI/penicillin-binding protein 2